MTEVAHNRAGDDELAIVETCGMQLDEDLVGGELGGRWDLDVLLVLEGGFEAILAVEDPLTSHGVRCAGIPNE